jgi:hypothetical protein
MSNTSATNGDLQPQPLYGMSLNSYPGQVPPPPYLLGRSAPLNTVGPSELLPRPFGLYTDRPVCSAGQSGVALGPPPSLLGRSTTLDVVGPSDPYADRPTFYAGQSGAVPGMSRGTPIMANTIGQFRCTTIQTGYTYEEPAVAHHTPNYYTPQQQYVSPSTYLNHNAPYNHRPINTTDRSRQEGRYTNARPNEPRSPGSSGLPTGAMEKIREEMTELFRDKFRVSVARVGQSYQKPYNHRFDTVPYPQGTRISEFSKFSGENGRNT